VLVEVRQGTFLGGIGGSQLLSQPVGLGYLPNGPMRGGHFHPSYTVYETLKTHTQTWKPSALIQSTDPRLVGCRSYT
jgi:hypothetical protein